MKQITDTGIRGFLQWYETVQPALAKELKKRMMSGTPQVFSDYHAGGYLTAGKSHDEALKISARSLGLLGQGSPFDLFSGTPTLDESLLPASAPSTVDVTQAANSGPTSTSTTDWIANAIKGISSLYLTKQQADIQQQVVNTQLARAAAGLPPLPSSLANLGVPQVSVGVSTGTGAMLALGGGLVLLYLLFGQSSRRK